MRGGTLEMYRASTRKNMAQQFVGHYPLVTCSRFRTSFSTRQRCWPIISF